MEKERIQEGKLILLVDDNDACRKVAKNFIELGGYRIAEAQEGQEAIEKFKKGNYDLVLLDLNMPLVTGFDVARVIRRYAESIGSNPIIIALSGSASDYAYADDSFFKDAGFNDHLDKTRITKKLLPMLEKYLGRQ